MTTASGSMCTTAGWSAVARTGSGASAHRCLPSSWRVSTTARKACPDPWRRNVDASLELIDDLELQIAQLSVELKRQGADHRYIPLLVTAPGFGWINAYTVASEIGDIDRFASPTKLCGYTALCPRVYQSAQSDRRGRSQSKARATCAGHSSPAR